MERDVIIGRRREQILNRRHRMDKAVQHAGGGYSTWRSFIPLLMGLHDTL